jgi:hypothetical protein
MTDLIDSATYRYLLEQTGPTTARLLPTRVPGQDDAAEMFSRHTKPVFDLAELEAKMGEFEVRRIEMVRDALNSSVLARLRGFETKLLVHYEATTKQAALIRMFFGVAGTKVSE